MDMNSLATLIDLNGWVDVRRTVISREGYAIDASAGVWHLPDPTRKNSSLNFDKILEQRMRWVTMRYVQEKLQRTSTVAGYQAFQAVWYKLFRQQSDAGIVDGISTEVLKQRLISLVEKALSNARGEHHLWEMYLPIQWYVWCAENYPELGFCPAYALELDSITIPGSPRGEAVRMEDQDRGPLHRSLELPLLLRAMRMDKSHELRHLQEKAALALSIAFGRNPANLTYLKEHDLVNLTPDSGDPTWIIRMPRIKKRQLNPRDHLLDEYLDPEFAGYLVEMRAASKEVPMSVMLGDKSHEIDRPLFVNVRGNAAARRSGLTNSYFNMTSEDICKLIQRFVKRHNIISPLTGELLRISTRRLRYTLGTGLAAEGISRKELARILDHTDTQHVQVYFDIANSIVEHLDKAVAKAFAVHLNLFRGRIIRDDSEAINGDRDDKHLAFVDESNPTDWTDIGVCGKGAICHLDPPFSCYLCEKFQPYLHADHEHVLECLLHDRDERMHKYENARLGVQLDDVIFAVARTALDCELRRQNG